MCGCVRARQVPCTARSLAGFLLLSMKRSLSPSLPEGWESRYTKDGERYYVHHGTKETTWEDPRQQPRPPSPSPSPSPDRSYDDHDADRELEPEPEPAPDPDELPPQQQRSRMEPPEPQLQHMGSHHTTSSSSNLAPLGMGHVNGPYMQSMRGPQDMAFAAGPGPGPGFAASGGLQPGPGSSYGSGSVYPGGGEFGPNMYGQQQPNAFVPQYAAGGVQDYAAGYGGAGGGGGGAGGGGCVAGPDPAAKRQRTEDPPMPNPEDAIEALLRQLPLRTTLPIAELSRKVCAHLGVLCEVLSRSFLVSAHCQAAPSFDLLGNLVLV